MTTISSFLPSFSGTTSANRTPTPYEINARQFGPVGATAIGVAAQATDMASATATFSADGLKKLSDLAGSAVDSVEGAISEVGDGLASIGHTIADDATKAYRAVADTANAVVSGIGDAVQSVEDGVASAASSAAGYVALGISALT
jgi:phage-related protein